MFHLLEFIIMMSTVCAGKDVLSYLDKAFSDINIYQFTFVSYTPEQITLLYGKIKGWCSAFLVQYADDCYCRLTFVSYVGCIPFAKKMWTVCHDLGLSPA